MHRFIRLAAPLVAVAGLAGCFMEQNTSDGVGTETAALGLGGSLESPTQGQVLSRQNKRSVLFQGTAPYFGNIQIQIARDPHDRLMQAYDWATLDQFWANGTWERTVDYTRQDIDGGVYNPDVAWAPGGLARFRVLVNGSPATTSECDTTGCHPYADFVTLADSTPPPSAADGAWRSYLHDQALYNAAGELPPEAYADKIDGSDGYYAHLVNGDGTPTFPILLSDYLSQYGISNASDGMIYYNARELGWGRNLRCQSWQPAVAEINSARGFTCYVINYDDGNHGAPAANPAQYLAGAVKHQLTGDDSQVRNYVIIHYNPVLPADARVQFAAYARDTNGVFVRQNKVMLDSGAARPSPMVCLNCHGGRYDETRHLAVGSSFLPLNINEITLPDPALTPAFERPAQEQSVGWINVFAYNTSPNLQPYIANMYGFPTGAWFMQPTGLATPNPSPVPAEWENDAKLYRDVYEPHCLSCHRARVETPYFKDIKTSADFRVRLREIAQRVCGAEPSMPHAEMMMRNFWNSNARASLVDALSPSDASMSRTDGVAHGACAPARTFVAGSYQTNFPTAIPDKGIGGPGVASQSIEVAEDFSFSSVKVTARIIHGWPNDVYAELLKDGVHVATLKNAPAPFAPNHEYTFAAANLGAAAGRGTWTLRVLDLDAAYAGTIEQFKLGFEIQSGHSYANATPVAIVDPDPSGGRPVESTVQVSDAFEIASLAVDVDISHTWIGDLRVELIKDGATVAILADREGGSTHDILKTYTLSATDLAGVTGSTGVWGLRGTDLAAADVGTINKVTLTFQPVD